MGTYGWSLTSQPTLSRLLATLGEPDNRAVLGEAVIRQAEARLRAANGGHRKRRLTLDFDGLGLTVAGLLSPTPRSVPGSTD